MTKIYDYTIPQSSSTGHIDVPIDLETYRRILIEMDYEPGSGQGLAWGLCEPLSASKSAYNCAQVGYEISETAMRFINRYDFPQIVAYGLASYSSAHAQILLTRALTGNWITYTANGYGGNNNQPRAQSFQGRIYASGEYVKFVRFEVNYPQGGSIVMYGQK